MDGIKNEKQLTLQIEELTQQLEEANDTIDAIRSGKIDALVVRNKNGSEIYTLKSADQTYRVFIEKMNEGALTLNRDGVILYSNSRVATMLELPLTKIIGSYFKEYIEASEINTFDELFKNGWKTESKSELNLFSEIKKSIPVLLSLTALELEDGTALSVIITDLTDQKAIEKELKGNNILLESARDFTENLNTELELRVKERTLELLVSREHFKFLADTIPVIIWTTTPDGNPDYFNRQWYEYTGLTFEESRTTLQQSVIHPADLSQIMKTWENSLATGTSFKTEIRLRSAYGTYRWHLANTLPFRDKEGEILAWFGVSTDIEGQKKDLKKKDEFISMASHELKTPVTSLKVFTEIMLMDAEKKGDKNELGMLKKMDKQINKLTILISDLLDVSKANSGQLSYDFEEFDFNNLVKETMNEMQLTYTHFEFDLKLVDSETVIGDRNRLGQVINNLVSNAVKYSPNGDKIMIFSEKSGRDIKLSVKDFGIGIPIADQPKLFSRFFRVSESTFPGLGLGLYICKEIIKRHSGTINFKSKEGKGSVFSFTLPVKKNLLF
ncbi:MAG: ATP-binding protein [Ginsengibacter sp.]